MKGVSKGANMNSAEGNGESHKKPRLNLLTRQYTNLIQFCSADFQNLDTHLLYLVWRKVSY